MCHRSEHLLLVIFHSCHCKYTSLSYQFLKKKHRFSSFNAIICLFGMSKLVMLVGTKLQHVVSTLALEIVEQTGPSVGAQLKPRDDLFWFGKPEVLLRLIQFIIFQVMTTHGIHSSIITSEITICILFPAHLLSCMCRMPSRWQHLYGHW